MKKPAILLLLAVALPAGAQAPAPPVPAAPPPPAPTAPVVRDSMADREALSSAIDSRDVAKATALLDANPKIIKMRDQQRRLPLTHAAEYASYGGDKDKTVMLALLIARGADLNASDDQQGQTPLVFVVSRGNDRDMTVFNFLTDKGASLTAFGTDGQTPLQAAAAQGNVDLVNKLLAKGVDVNLRGGTGDTALHAAAGAGDVKTVRALINSGANVNLRNDRGDTPLHVAMRLYGMPDNIAASHTSSGFFIRYSGPGGQRQDGSIREALLAHGAQVGLRDQYGLTPLLYALLNRDKSGRFLMLQHHAPVDTQTAFFQAAALGDVPTLTRLAAANPALVTGRAPNGATPLHVAALWNARKSLAWLLKRGAETTARDAYALAPLHYACRAPDAQDTAADLIAAGANVMAEDGAGDTPLHYAARALAKDTAGLLLAHGGKINARDGMGATPLLLVPDMTHTDLVALLLDKGADINAHPRYGGGGLLTSAIQQGAKDTVALLLDKGADPNVQDNFGNGSPLLSAIQSRNKDIVALLLDKGADPTVKTPWGETLLQTAKNWGGNSTEVVALLQKHMPPGAGGAADAPKPDAAK